MWPRLASCCAPLVTPMASLMSPSLAPSISWMRNMTESFLSTAIASNAGSFGVWMLGQNNTVYRYDGAFNVAANGMTAIAGNAGSFGVWVLATDGTLYQNDVSLHLVTHN